MNSQQNETALLQLEDRAEAALEDRLKPELQRVPLARTRLNGGGDPRRQTGDPLTRGMTRLVLSRRDTERVIVGDCVIEVLAASRGRVRLLISAPPGTPILREELLERTLRESEGRAGREFAAVLREVLERSEMQS